MVVSHGSQGSLMIRVLSPEDSLGVPSIQRLTWKALKGAFSLAVPIPTCATLKVFATIPRFARPAYGVIPASTCRSFEPAEWVLLLHYIVTCRLLCVFMRLRTCKDSTPSEEPALSLPCPLCHPLRQGWLEESLGVTVSVSPRYVQGP